MTHLSSDSLFFYNWSIFTPVPFVYYVRIFVFTIWILWLLIDYGQTVAHNAFWMFHLRLLFFIERIFLPKRKNNNIFVSKSDAYTSGILKYVEHRITLNFLQCSLPDDAPCFMWLASQKKVTYASLRHSDTF